MTAAPQPPSPHPDHISRRRLLTGAGALAAGAVLAAALPESVVEAAAVPANASTYVPLTPFRILDTRKGLKNPCRRVGNNRLRIALGGYTDRASRQRIDPKATAIVANVTAINGTQAGHVLVFPSNLASLPRVSIMNLRTPGQVTANMVTTKLSSRGEIDLSTLHHAELLVDVIGYYRPVRKATRAGRFQPITASRAYDSRRGNPRPRDRGSVVVDVTKWTKADATAVVVNIAAVLSKGPGHVSAVPVWQRDRPATSTLNLKYGGDNVSGSAIVPIRTHKGKRRIRVYTHAACDVIVDVRGYFTGDKSRSSTDGLFVPLTPQRILDTRGLWPDKLGRPLGQLWDDWIVEAPLTKHTEISAAKARSIGAVVVNLTAFESRGFPRPAGHFTLSAARLPVPRAAVVNWSAPGSYAANHVISEVSTAGIQIHTVTGAAALIDLNGYYTGQPRAPRLRAPSLKNQVPPPIPPKWQLQIPNLWDSTYGQHGRWATVIDHHDGDAAVDSGNLWHWTNTGNMLDGRDVFILGHRTSAGGPFRNLHLLPAGSLMFIDTADRRRYTFRYKGMRLAGKDAASILNTSRYYSGTTVSLVACTVGHSRPGTPWYEPTSLDWRIVSTFEFVDWRVL